MRSLVLAVLVSLSAASAALAGPGVVVSTVAPLHMVVVELAGDRVEAKLLLGPGDSPHTYSPKPSDLAMVSRARLFLAVGLGNEVFLDEIKRVASGAKVVELAEEMLERGMFEPIRGHHHHGSHGDHGHGEGDHHDVNPHVWLSPRIGVRMVERIAELLSEIDPEGAKLYGERSRGLVERLKALDAEMSSFASSHRVSMIDVHGAFAYLARDYGFDLVGVVQETPGAEPSGKYLADLIERGRARGVNVVVVEPQLPPKLAEVLARELGARVLRLDPLGDPAKETYDGLLRRNFEAIARAVR